MLLAHDLQCISNQLLYTLREYLPQFVLHHWQPSLGTSTQGGSQYRPLSTTGILVNPAMVKFDAVVKCMYGQVRRRRQVHVQLADLLRAELPLLRTTLPRARRRTAPETC